MKRLSILAALLSIVAVGCKGSSSSPSKAATPTQTNTTFTVPLAPSQEVPAAAAADQTITGSATIVLHVIKDTSGAVTSATADFNLVASGFAPGSALNMAHIHPGGTGVAGGVLISTGMTPGAVTITNGSVNYTSNGVNVAAQDAQGIASNPAGYYFNIHTTASPGGAARGQLGSGGTVTTDPTPAPGY